jgi:hypothetical protein
MFEFVDQCPAVSVQEAEYVRLLGFPRDHALEGRSRELADWAREWYAARGRPWMFARAAGGLDTRDGTVSFGGEQFCSERLREQLEAAEAHDAMLVAVSAGKECEDKARQCWQDGKPDEYFFMEMFGSAVVEDLVTHAAGRICAWAEERGMAVLPHYSPGYSGWPISDQMKLWQLLRGNPGRAFPADLEVMETGMLRPKKSLLAVFGLTQHTEKVVAGSRLVPCDNCALSKCQYRRSPYRYAMPQPETFARVQNGNGSRNDDSHALEANARYSTNSRALRKWAQERLHLEVAIDGSVTARFRYEGTTCANLGHPIHYDYYVKLQPPAQEYRVAELRCGPAPYDVGHLHMCEYLKDPDDFMKNLAVERPLVNRPLNDVLSWKRAYNPAGCYCEASSREHKWGLVFEVIHFALAQGQAKKPGNSGEQKIIHDEAL